MIRAVRYPYVFLAWGRKFSNASLKVTDVTGKYGYYSVRAGLDPDGKLYPYGDLANVNSTRWALYVQDSWTIKNRLTINLEPSLLITGLVQNEEGVIHVMAEEIAPLCASRMASPCASLPG